MKHTLYSEYSEIQPVKIESIKAKPKGSAYEKLENLIGITEAKNVINKAIRT